MVKYLTSDEGKADLKDLGGLSSATAGVILRELIAFSDQGADAFFGEPEFDTRDLLRDDRRSGHGLISLVELPNLQDRPAVFSTFLMWLLADLFHDLPEVGDLDKPKLVFFFDEAHLLFADASKAFLDAIAQTVRLIRSKGVGVFFVTQSPTDVPSDVLAQLGSRDPAPAARGHAQRRQGAEADGEHLPALGLPRPGAGDPLPRHRRGDRHRDERARRPHPGGVDPAARTGVVHGRRGQRRDGAGREGLTALRDVRRERSTASRPARSSRPSSRKAPRRQRVEQQAEADAELRKEAARPPAPAAEEHAGEVRHRGGGHLDHLPPDRVAPRAREFVRGVFKHRAPQP